VLEGHRRPLVGVDLGHLSVQDGLRGISAEVGDVRAAVAVEALCPVRSRRRPFRGCAAMTSGRWTFPPRPCDAAYSTWDHSHRKPPIVPDRIIDKTSRRGSLIYPIVKMLSRSVAPQIQSLPSPNDVEFQRPLAADE
jgi:hypothetical protein